MRPSPAATASGVHSRVQACPRRSRAKQSVRMNISWRGAAWVGAGCSEVARRAGTVLAPAGGGEGEEHEKEGA